MNGTNLEVRQYDPESSKVICWFADQYRASAYAGLKTRNRR